MLKYIKNTDFNRFCVALTIFALILILVIKFVFVSNYFLIISTFLYEFAIFGIILAITFYFYSKSKLFSIIFFYFFFILNFLISFFWSYYLDFIVGWNISFYSINKEVLLFVLTQIVNLKYVLLILFLLGLFLLISVFISKYLFRLNKKKIIILFICSLFLLLIVPFVFQNNNFENVYYNSVNTTIQKIFFKNPEFYADNNCNLDLNFLWKNKYPNLDLNSKYSKIVVFVMEEVLFENFYKYQKKIPKEENFYELYKNNSNYFFNYYTTNQDSITAIISMISSRFVPNEAYIYNEEYSLCAHDLYYNYDLIDYFNDLNFYTSFYVSSVQPACELTKYNWDNIVDIKGRFNELNKTNMCFSPFPYDTACEDEVLLDKLISDLNKDNVFIMQEFIFGHNNFYLKESKKSKTEYYNNYFYEFYKKIKENNWEDDLLLILVSDHGNKGFEAYSDFQGYNIPLIIIANDLNYYENNNLYSHLDFKDILFKYVFNIDFNSDSQFFLVGPTASNVLGIINNSSGNIFEKKHNYYSLISEKGILNSQEYLNCFYNYQKEFNKGINMP